MRVTSRRILGAGLVVALLVWALPYMLRYFSTAPRAVFDPAGPLLAPLLKPRVAGTPGGLAARAHIAETLGRAGWEVEHHEFTAKTPVGEVPMANVLARRAGRADEGARKLTLAAHYDSKPKPDGFVGATDSAFPCALLLHLAQISRAQHYDFDLVFFDGEEAFVNWSDDDSIYGARALAAHQARENSLPETLVLLDLLGNEARFPIPSWFQETADLHAELAALAPQLVGGRNLHHLAGMMQDDHIPFLQRGVPVLHLIPSNFPDVWHTLGDNVDVLDPATMHAWGELFEKWLYKDT